MRAFFIAVFLALYSISAQAGDSRLRRVEAYLNGLNTVVADFTQVSPDGSLTGGKFYFERPGKMRWEYAPPTPILIVSSGSQLIYFDKDLAQTTYIPMDSTPAGFLANDPIRFDASVVVEEVSDIDGVLRVTLHQAKKPEEGSLTLEFSDTPFALRNLIITDAAKQVTSVSLSNAHFGEKLDPDLFSLRK